MAQYKAGYPCTALVNAPALAGRVREPQHRQYSHGLNEPDFR
ncbi:hypothetical protein BN1184_BE_00770 [Pantoea ananatis]|nr:hypothetical protein BN1182_BQ_00150 [Pantoea ananatis]CRH39096.1 hypothetical protein BN1184_BE_00770 [Pantoea ananatis]